MALGPCLSDVQLELLAADPTAGDKDSDAWRHLSACQLCSKRLAEFQANLRLFDSLRRVYSTSQRGAIKPSSLAGMNDGGELKPGTVIGRYRILRFIATGGFGTVYLARQIIPFERLVVLKFLRKDKAKEEGEERFRFEIDTLANLEHKYIARLYDAELTRDGQWFLVMEYVEGLELTRHCDEFRLPLQFRLTTFQRVCKAVHYFHEHGVIHRDLKPSNILAKGVEGRAEPRVIDFGLAKFRTPNRTPKREETIEGHVIGTIGYMSPEQAAGRIAEIDRRSDVFSLAVILYELLTGTVPWDFSLPAEKDFWILQRATHAVDIPWPSKRIAAADQARIARIAEQRRTTPEALLSTLRGELDWIVMRGLEWKPDDRYPTAMALAEDIDRFLKKLPVTAHRPTNGISEHRVLGKPWRMLARFGISAAILLIGLATINQIWPGWMPVGTAVILADPVSFPEERLLKLVADVAEGADPSEVAALASAMGSEPALVRPAVNAIGSAGDATVRDPILHAALPWLRRLDVDSIHLVVWTLLNDKYSPAYDDISAAVQSIPRLTRSPDLWRAIDWNDLYDKNAVLAESLLQRLVILSANDRRSQVLVPVFGKIAIDHGSEEMRSILKSVTAERDRLRRIGWLPSYPEISSDGAFRPPGRTSNALERERIFRQTVSLPTNGILNDFSAGAPHSKRELRERRLSANIDALVQQPSGTSDQDAISDADRLMASLVEDAESADPARIQRAIARIVKDPKFAHPAVMAMTIVSDPGARDPVLHAAVKWLPYLDVDSAHQVVWTLLNDKYEKSYADLIKALSTTRGFTRNPDAWRSIDWSSIFAVNPALGEEVIYRLIMLCNDDPQAAQTLHHFTKVARNHGCDGERLLMQNPAGKRR